MVPVIEAPAVSFTVRVGLASRVTGPLNVRALDPVMVGLPVTTRLLPMVRVALLSRVAAPRTTGPVPSEAALPRTRVPAVTLRPPENVLAVGNWITPAP